MTLFNRIKTIFIGRTFVNKTITSFEKWTNLYKEQKPLLQKKILRYSRNSFDNLPALFEVLARNTHHQKKELQLKDIYLRRLETACISLPKQNALLYFAFLPTLLLSALIIVPRCLPQHTIHSTNKLFSSTLTNSVIPVIRTASLNPITTTKPITTVVSVKTITNPITTSNTLKTLPLPLTPAQQKKSVIGDNHLEYVSLTIHKSIYLSGKKAGVSAKMVSQLINIFNGAVNFAKDVHDGDRIAILYNKNATPIVAASNIVSKTGKNKHRKNIKAVPALTNEIVAAEIISHKKTYRAVKFTDAAGHSDYYTPEGVSLKPAFVRAPAAHTHITSRFDLHRWHPILHIFRAHKGVDFAAPQGTPIKATGAGRIAFAGWEGGYGKAILIRHDNKYSSFYAHLSGFAKKLSVGSYVKQNQLIGFMGSTGLATGSHVHYEFRINGVQHDPLTTPLPHLAINSHSNRMKFMALAKVMLAQLEGRYPQYYAAAKTIGNSHSRPAV